MCLVGTILSLSKALNCVWLAHRISPWIVAETIVAVLPGFHP